MYILNIGFKAKTFLFFKKSATIFKCYLDYKTILCHEVALGARLKNFLFEAKIMFLSRDVEIFVCFFLNPLNPQISKSMTLS